MVLAALCEQFLPSNRGISRNRESLAAGNDRQLWHQHHYHNRNLRRYSIQHGGNHSVNSSDRSMNSSSESYSSYTRNSILDLSLPEDEPTNEKPYRHHRHRHHETIPNMGLTVPLEAAAIRPKRNRCKASKLLASLAADFDVLTDWLFYAHCRNSNVESYRETGIYQIPPWLVGMVLLTCVIGTTLWLILATDGAIATPVLRFLGYDKLSLGHILLGCVLLEDLPQVVLTFFIEDYFEEDQEFNNYAVMNVVASLYDILIKLAEAYDQRADVVETGHWCKERIEHAHHDKVICVVPIPDSGCDEDNEDEEEEEEDHGGNLLLENRNNTNNRVVNSVRDYYRRPPQQQQDTSSSLFQNRLHVPKEHQSSSLSSAKKRRRRTLFQEAQDMIADTKLPPMRFLSASKDGTVKLWDTSLVQPKDETSRSSSSSFVPNSSTGRTRKPSKTFAGHGRRVSCIAFVRKVGRRDHDRQYQNPNQPNETTAKEATQQGTEETENSKVNPQHYWKTDPKERKDSYYFLTGSYDGTSKLWSTNSTRSLQTYSTLSVDNESAAEVTSIAYIGKTNEGTNNTEEALHSSALFSPPPLSSSTTNSDKEYFVNGYRKGKVKLWDLWSGACLRIFEEQTLPRSILSRVYNRHGKASRIYSLCSMEDSRHFAAGSMDGSIKMWDIINNDIMGDNEIIVESEESESEDSNSHVEMIAAANSNPPKVSATPAQIFSGHTKTVFAIQCVCPGAVLLSGSEDKTARLWSVSTGACLRTFVGHRGPVHDVAVVDQVTFLTASRDQTIMAWDALSGESFRTYDNRELAPSPVTAVATGNQSGCFLTGAQDGSVGLWIFSAVHDQHDRDNIREFDDEEFVACGGCQADEESLVEEINDARAYRGITE